MQGQRETGRRILIVYSDIGDGHLSAARNLEAELRSEAPDADIVLENGFEALGRLLRWFMRDFYRRQYSSVPRLYGFSYELFRRVWILRALAASVLILLGEQRLQIEPILAIEILRKIAARRGHAIHGLGDRGLAQPEARQVSDVFDVLA